MRISTKGRYGLYLMMELAGNCTKSRCTSLKNIAASQGVSEKYLEQIVQILNKEKLLVSTRDAYGGYKLAGKPSEISVGTILRCLEKTIDIPECEETADKSVFVSIVCKEVYDKIDEAVSNLLNNITLEDLLNKYEENYTLDYII